MAFSKKAIEKISARVFCQAGSNGGGNPVTVFSSASQLPDDVQTCLAKSCEWESVMVSSASPDVKDMSFFMPSGEQVSFCAHAALGGAFATSNQTESSLSILSRMLSDQQQTVRIIERESEMAGTSSLTMSATYEGTPVGHPPTLARLLRSHLGLGSEHLVSRGRDYPSLLNASVARPKTLVHVNSIDALHKAKQPKVASDTKQRNSFAAACGAVDDSTGIYLYATRPDEEGAWECRQFPRASGYSEDAATGIAAGALATSLFMSGIYYPVYKFYQGTAMQRPSLIEVLDLQIADGKDVQFTLRARVEIDDRESVEL